MLPDYSSRIMEKEKLTSPASLRNLGVKVLVSLALAIPLWGMLKTSTAVLAEVELGDPVKLYETHPSAMSFFRWCVIVGILFAFSPFKSISALATGLAVGGLAFYGMDLQSQLEELSKMGLSEKPLTEMVVLSKEGMWLIRWCVMACAMQCLLGLILPAIHCWRLRKIALAK